MKYFTQNAFRQIILSSSKGYDQKTKYNECCYSILWDHNTIIFTNHYIINHIYSFYKINYNLYDEFFLDWKIFIWSKATYKLILVSLNNFFFFILLHNNICLKCIRTANESIWSANAIKRRRCRNCWLHLTVTSFFLKPCTTAYEWRCFVFCAAIVKE